MHAGGDELVGVQPDGGILIADQQPTGSRLLRLNPDGMTSLTETLAAEGALRTADGLCRPVVARTGASVDVDHEELMFGSSEYVKDGLLNVYERHGGGLVGENLLAIVDALIAGSRHASRFGSHTCTLTSTLFVAAS